MNWAAARATTAIAAVTAIVSLFLILTGLVPDAAVGAGFIPLRFEGAALPPDFGFAVPTILTPLTATLIHGGFAHIAFNLVMLVYCGAQTERALGPRGIAILYVVGAYAAAIAQYFPDPNSPMPMIGASGAISAIVVSSGSRGSAQAASAIVSDVLGHAVRVDRRLRTFQEAWPDTVSAFIEDTLSKFSAL